MKKAVSTIDEYALNFPPELRKVLQQIRTAVTKAVPDAEETISYAIPTFKLNGISLVHFALFKNHIGFYATPTGHERFKTELSKYKQGKGSVQFPLDKPMPLELIAKIAQFRANERSADEKNKLSKRVE
jgi:uncharacterized protein YdhG (YjbR/CyaY superfamily)